MLNFGGLRIAKTKSLRIANSRSKIPFEIYREYNSASFYYFIFYRGW